MNASLNTNYLLSLMGLDSSGKPLANSSAATSQQNSAQQLQQQMQTLLAMFGNDPATAALAAALTSMPNTTTNTTPVSGKGTNLPNVESGDVLNLSKKSKSNIFIHFLLIFV